MRNVFGMIAISSVLLSILAGAPARADDTALCGPLIKLAEQEWLDRDVQGERKLRSTPLNEVRGAARLFIFRLTDDSDAMALLEATRKGVLSADRLVEALNRRILEPAIEDMESLPAMGWSRGRYRLRVESYVDSGGTLHVNLKSCPENGSCIFVDLLERADLRALVERDARVLAGESGLDKDEYVRSSTPDFCRSKAAVAGRKIEGVADVKTVPVSDTKTLSNVSYSTAKSGESARPVN